MSSTLKALLACAAGLLAACGQTGPLYLPDEAIRTPVEIRPAPAPPAEAATAPADSSEDDQADASSATAE